MSEHNTPNRQGEHLETLASRLRRVATAGLTAFIVVGASYWYYQVIEGPHFGELAENNRIRRGRITAPRGLIHDRHGRLLVENVPSYDLLLDRSLSADLEASVDLAVDILERPREEFETAVERSQSLPKFRPITVAQDLTLSEVARFEAASIRHPEFSIEVQKRRLYRHGPQTAHLLGYLGEASQDEIRELDRSSGDLVGREGIEQAWDDRLRGDNGEREVVVDSRGKVVEEYRRASAVPGEPLRLTIDLDLQKEAAFLLEGLVGAVIALDPRDGAVRAMVSSPSYDPNQFVRGLKASEWRELVESDHHPLQNRGIQNTYPPGSVFKIVMAVAALEEGFTDPARTIWCNGSTRIYERRRRCWKAGGHGWVDLLGALRESCDVYFYKVGNEMGIGPIGTWAKHFGLGTESAVGLPGERGGLVPDETYRERRRTPWYAGETISVAIGQGPILTTPLQVAAMVAIAANGGYRVKPYLVEGQAAARQKLAIAPENLARVRDGLRAVVNDEGGTGRVARLDDHLVAGKTGTAQVVEQKTRTASASLDWQYREHAWFAAFAPYDDPELVVVIFVEHGGSGSGSAAPLARALYEKYFSLQRVYRSPTAG